MAGSTLLGSLRDALTEIDPRRSLMAATIWLVAALAAGFAAAASFWAGSAAEEIVVQQHARRLALETDQFASDLAQALNERVDALRLLGDSPAPMLYARLSAALPELDWLEVADSSGHIVGARDAKDLNRDVKNEAWFIHGSNGPWLGQILEETSEVPNLGQMALPARGRDGSLTAVVAVGLRWHYALADIERLSTTLNPKGSAQSLVLDRDGVVLIGPEELRNKQWNGVALSIPPPLKPASTPQFERVSGVVMLVARAPLRGTALQDAGWQVQLCEPKDNVYLRANALRTRILWISVLLAAITGLAGALVARHLTSRLRRLTRSAKAVGRGAQGIEVPSGLDEVAQLGTAFGAVLNDLQRERQELLKLSEDLERRVAARTREVERLAEESRFAAVVRERLKMARDLHDTLAHSMMAMLAEIRLLKKLHTSRPEALAEELERAEAVAHEGLNEAREAIAQMRVSGVREVGLGAALKTLVERFTDRTGLASELNVDAGAAGFGDERAETLLRMADEALRNVEKHAQARRVEVRLSSDEDGWLELSVRDDGIGFDTRESYPGHFGLVGLREQAQLIGATFAIDSSSDKGTIVRVRLATVPSSL
jgi:signal transduction histidine kinase